MIGLASLPSGLAFDRMCRNGDSEVWREPWDVGDGIISAMLSDLNRSHSQGPIAVHSYRSNSSEISIVRDETGWQVGWDERFFDHLILHLLLLREPAEENVRMQLASLITLYIGETYLVSDPHYAKTLIEEAEAFSPHTGRVFFDAPDEFMLRLECCFRMMRAFVLFHEWAHIALKQPDIYDRERKVLETTLKEAKEATRRQNSAKKMNRGFQSEYFVDKLADAVSESSGRSDVVDEMLADTCALNALVQMEIVHMKHSRPNMTVKHAAWVFSLIYESIVLLNFFLFTMNGARELLRPKSIRHGFTMGQFRSVRALTARADVRGNLWKLKAAQHFNYDINQLTLLAEMNVGLKEHYSQTVAQSWYQFQLRFRRADALANADKLRSKITEDAAREEIAERLGYSFWH